MIKSVIIKSVGVDKKGGGTKALIDKMWIKVMFFVDPSFTEL